MDARFDHNDIKLMRCMAEHFAEHGNPRHLQSKLLTFVDIANYVGLSERDTLAKLSRFASYGWIEMERKSRNPAHQYVTIDPTLLAALAEIDNPPPRDLWRELTVWAKR